VEVTATRLPLCVPNETRQTTVCAGRCYPTYLSFHLPVSFLPTESFTAAVNVHRAVVGSVEVSPTRSHLSFVAFATRISHDR
jgi:hypothetical protein